MTIWQMQYEFRNAALFIQKVNKTLTVRRTLFGLVNS